MLALLLLAIKQSDISSELEQALAGKKLAGPAFHQAIDPVLNKYGALKTTLFERTVGDPRGMLLTVAGSGSNWDDTTAWRVFLWPESTKIRAQVIKRFGDYSNSAIDSYTDGDIFWRGDRLVIVGRDLDGSSSSRAGLTSYLYANAHWKLDQHLASERQGVAVFARLENAIDPSRILVRTRLRPDHFRVPSDGPMLTFSETWLLKNGRYVQGKPQQQDTAVAALDSLVGLARKGDHKSFEAIVPASYRDAMWRAITSPTLAVEANGGDNDFSKAFRLGPSAMIVSLGKVNGKWTITQLLQQ